jgi:hypothetical protein
MTYLIATWLRAGRPGDRIPTGTRDLLYSKTSLPDLRFTQSRIKCVLVSFLLAVKWLGHDVTMRLHVAEVNNEYNCTSTPPIGLHGIYRGRFMLCYFSTSMFGGKVLRNLLVLTGRTDLRELPAVHTTLKL